MSFFFLRPANSNCSDPYSTSDSNAKIAYKKLSEASFANRHMVSIRWSKAQELPVSTDIPHIEALYIPTQFDFRMTDVANPDAKQSEAFVATVALFLTFGSSAKEEKLSLKLPPVWRDLWDEFSNLKKHQLDERDRVEIRQLRDLVRKRQDQELEDGVLLQGAFRGRAGNRTSADAGEDSVADRAQRQSGDPEYFQNIWRQKSASPAFQSMLVRRRHERRYRETNDLTCSPAIANAAPDVGFSTAGA
jgi:ATP-dependent RNA helicase DHX29